MHLGLDLLFVRKLSGHVFLCRPANHGVQLGLFRIASLVSRGQKDEGRS